MRLEGSFFDRNTIQVAKDLLGKKIVRVFDDGTKIEAVITETEAYHGFDDRASHASRKKTDRNKIMFDRAGVVYVYLVYGMHYCLNFVTMEEEFPAAVLVRGIIIEKSKIKSQNGNLKLENYDIKNLLKTIKLKIKNFVVLSGPGRVCKALQIDKSFYGEDSAVSKRIWIESVGAEHALPNYDIIAGKRVGVDYAGESAKFLWNFKIKNLNAKSSSKSK